MIVLASYPRSGNTFFRNILHEVYGIESCDYHNESAKPINQEFWKFPVVKTHLLPSQLDERMGKKPVVLLVRDGRDCIVSMARFRTSVKDKNAVFEKIVEEAIIANMGSYFGGWSYNTKSWVPLADVIVKYEDLIRDPIKEVEKIRSLIDLPNADESKIPTFESQRSGNTKYKGSKGNREKHENFTELFFRRGVAGSWKDEFPTSLLNSYWEFHGPVMEALGYSETEGNINSFKVSEYKSRIENTPSSFHIINSKKGINKSSIRKLKWNLIGRIPKLGMESIHIDFLKENDQLLKALESSSKRSTRWLDSEKDPVNGVKHLIISTEKERALNFLGSKFPESCCIWVPHPIESVLDSFNYFNKRIEALLEEEKRDLNIKSKMIQSLEEFIENKNNQNVVSKFLDKVKLDRFFFVGRHSKFKEDFEVISKKLGLKRTESIHTSTGTEVEEKIKNRILELNLEDLVLYNKASELCQQRNEFLKHSGYLN